MGKRYQSNLAQSIEPQVRPSATRLASVALAIVLCSCDMEQLGLQSGTVEYSVNFDGLGSIDREPNGSYVLFWDKASYTENAEVALRYEIYLEDQGPNPLSLEGNADIQAVSIRGGRDIYKTVFKPGKSPHERGRLIKSLVNGDLSHTIEVDLAAGKQYAFQIKAVLDGTYYDQNMTGLVMSPHRSSAYKGCISASAVSFNSISLEIEYPDQAESVNVYRDGVVVHSSTSPLATLWVDTEVESGRSYKYRCEARVGQEIWEGRNELVAEVPIPPDPLDKVSQFQGCTSATPVSSTSIRVDFEFPDAADQVSLYRNGVVIFRATKDEKVYSYVDLGLSSDKTYQYKCEVAVENKTTFGPNALTSSPIDPFTKIAEFKGCKSAVPISSSAITVFFDFPKDAERVSVQRNGIEVFSTSHNEKFTSFDDAGLAANTTYRYSCIAYAEGKSTTGGVTKTVATFNPADRIAAFSGCSAATAMSESTVQVDWGFPTTADRVVVARNGVEVFSTSQDDKLETFTDVFLQPNSTYRYTCTAYADGMTRSGGVTKIVTTHNPADKIADFTGCSAATAISSTSVRVDWNFPPEADEVFVSRNGVEVYSTNNDDASGTFTDVNLTPTTTYLYKCTAVAGDATKSNAGIAVTTADPLASLSSFDGCTSATALSSSEIQVVFPFPAAATKMLVYRNSQPIHTSLSSADTIKIDGGLLEGVTYAYTCEAFIGNYSKLGSNALSTKTFSSNPPTFGGATTIAAVSGSSASLTWGVATGVPASEFRIYQSVGSSSDPFAEAAATIVPTLSLSALRTGLGDEIPYRFAVRACTAEGTCDANTTVRNLTLADQGPPSTPGLTNLAVSNGTFVLTAPWEPADGGLAVRRVYRLVDESASLVRSIPVDDIVNPPTSITLNSSHVAFTENTTYTFYIQDEDPSGNLSATTNQTHTVVTGDLTAPSFAAGILTLTTGTAPHQATSLNMTFTAIADELTDPVNGATHYIVLQKAGGGDACATGVEHTTLAVADFVAGQPSGNVAISGLLPRTNYSICLKAKDAAGNISSTSIYKTKQTLDTTAPNFDGVQFFTYDSATETFSVAWNAMTASDRDDYKVQIWKNTPSPDSSDITTVYKSHTNFSTGFSFSDETFSFTDNDEVYVLVAGCDDGDDIPGGSKNCSAHTYASARSRNVGDKTPPTGFSGINAAGLLLTPAEGEITVTWPAPASWTDYAGFKIYFVDTSNDTITLAKDCPCSGSNCPDQISTCTLSGLDLNRTYYLHVRAYDAAGNLTTYLSPTTSRSAKTTTDTTPPTFNASLQSVMNGTAVALSWLPASDLQYTGDGNTILYRVYRKTGSNFDDLSNPVGDADGLTHKYQGTSLVFTDSTVDDGTTYYFSVCAFDVAQNKTCSSPKLHVINDISKPIVADIVASKSDLNDWTLSWTMSDNTTASSSLITKIYLRIGDSAAEVPTTSNDYLLSSASGIGVTDLSVVNADDPRYYNYLVTATDEAGNVADGAAVSVFAGIALDPIADRNFANGTHLKIGVAVDPAIDTQNAEGGADTYIRYNCFYDRTADGTVASSSPCSEIPGLVFNSTTGSLTGTPGLRSAGTYEVKVEGNHSSSTATDSVTFVLQITEDYTTTNLLVDLDARFADGLNSGTSQSPSGWTDLSQNGNHGSLEGGYTWAGTGTSASPYHLSLDGDDAFVDLGTPLSGNSVALSAWIRPDAIATAGATIAATGPGLGNYFRLLQSPLEAGKLALQIGDYGAAVTVATPNSGPIAYYKLNETSGTSIADSVGAHDGNCTSCPTLGVDGAILAGDRAMRFTAANAQAISIADHADFDVSSLTVSAWVKGDNIAGMGGNTGPIVSKADFWWGAGWHLNYFKDASGLCFWVDNFNSRACAPVAASIDWTHVVGTYDGLTKSTNIYINGVLANSYTGPHNTMSKSNGPLQIGFVNSGENRRWNGDIDEVAIWGRALSDTEILAHYNVGVGCHSKSTMTDGDWVHAAALFDGSTSTLTINGREQCSVASPYLTLSESDSVTLGDTADGSNPFDGAISQAQVYSISTAAGVKADFDTAADRFRATSAAGVVTDNLVLQVDAANAMWGLRANADNSCDATIPWFDLSSDGNDGVLTNFSSCGNSSGWNGDGSVGNPHRLVFDGTDDRVAWGDPADGSLDFGNESFTISSWLTVSDSIFTRPVVAKAGSDAKRYYMHIMDDETVRCLASDGSDSPYANTTSPISVGNWNQVTCKFDKSNGIRIYVNGKEASTTATGDFLSNGSIASTNNFFIGFDQGNSENFTGEISHLSMYRSALSDTDLTQNFDALADRFRNHPLAGIVNDGLVLQLDPSNSTSKLRGNAAGTCADTNWTDLSSKGNDGTLTNFASCGASSGWNGDGTPGDPYQLTTDGSNDGVVVADADELKPAQISVEAWVNATQCNGWRSVITKTTGATWVNGYGLNCANSGNKIMFWINDEVTGSVDAVLQNNQWHHIVGTYDGYTVKIYVDGVLEDSQVLETELIHVADHLRIGHAAPGSFFWQGEIGYVSSYSRALSSSEVSQNCNALESRFTASDDICED